MRNRPAEKSLIISEQIYKMLLTAYPASFRHEYGADMAQLFRDSYRDAIHEGGVFAISQLWIGTLWDVLKTALVQHLQTQENPMSPFDRQLASTVQSMTVLLRGGYSVHQSLGLIAEKSPEPTASAFKAFVDEIQAGTSSVEALNNLKTRVSSPHLTTVIDTMLKQRETGGNLADQLDPVAEAIRQSAGDDAETVEMLAYFKQMVSV